MDQQSIDPGRVIDDSMVALSLSYDMTTDLSMMREVLREMQVDDLQTSYLPMQELLVRIASQPVDLGPMLTQVRWGLVRNAPAVVEFLSEALSRRWLSGSPHVNKAVHVAYVLEAITAAMCNSPVFFDEYVEHVRSKQKAIGIDHEHVFKSFLKMLPSSLNFFGTAKAISLDMALVYFRVGRYLGGADIDEQAVNELHAAGRISLLERKLVSPLCGKDRCACKHWLQVNIYEAGITEYENGFSMNAMAAHVLAEHVARHCHRETFLRRHVVPEGPTQEFYASIEGDDNYVPVVALSEEWKSLYLTWNMAFILGELNNLHYLFPKLLIPSVLCSRSENFLGTRIVSLWVSINSALLLNFNGVDTLTAPAGRREMARVWGEINQGYAEALYTSDLHPDVTALSDSFDERFAQPYANLAKLVMEFMKR
ncbi:MAG: hypothetical protein OXU33_07345 [Gemmatimonadota bacterium]|nr:hypothetical protein [Gemmatimonadota bacterium]MDE3013873.1 hypothetical protein [Gemmatimonadota bacterium]